MITRILTAIALAAALAACGGETETPSAPADAEDQDNAAPPSESEAQASNNNADAPEPSAEEPAAPSAERGRALFSACAVCHSVREGDNARIGPSLYGIYGRTAGTIDGFAYSKALLDSGVTWDDASLDAFLENPQRFMRGNRMAYPGERNAENRAHVIEYIKTLGADAAE